MNLTELPRIIRISTRLSEDNMAEKMNIGATFPELALNVMQAGLPDTTLLLPHAPASSYRVALFFRGHW